MRRREFIALLGGLAGAPLIAEAQQAAKLHRIGILSPERTAPEYFEAFRQGLSELGYIEGQNIVFEIRSAEGYGQLLTILADQLVKTKVDVILAINTPSVQAARKASTTIPIVMMRTADPVKSGLVTSLSRPGGNITGLSSMVDEVIGKRLALLKEALPNISNVAVLWYVPNPGSDLAVDAMKAPSRDLGLKLMPLPVHGPDELIEAFQTASRSQVEAVIVIEDSVATRNMVEILSLAEKSSVAVVSQYKAFAEAGAILAYGPNPWAMYHRAAYYVDRILRGVSAGDLPVEEPSKFDLVINLKTAKALGVTIPHSLLIRADEVIE
jgi:putative ABC transport system substrate-binding protein